MSKELIANSQNVKPQNASHVGILDLGGVQVDCAGLDDGTRVISTRGMHRALGRTVQPSREVGVHKNRRFVGSERLNPFVSEDLKVCTRNPIEYIVNGGAAVGIPAHALPLICKVWLDAREAGALHHKQAHIAQRAQRIIIGLAQVGVIALVDEATGYELHRAPGELQSHLRGFIQTAPRAWQREFPPEFSSQLYRLTGLPNDQSTSGHPQVFATYTNQIIYDRMPAGFREAMNTLNPTTESGSRARRIHQYLTPEQGVPELRVLIRLALSFMRIARSVDEVVLRMDGIKPRFGRPIPLPLMEAAA